jgi:hypothetical protein
MRILFLGLLCASTSFAQVDFPGNPTVTPKGFKTRQVGGGVNPGKPLDAKLIAFEDLVAQAPKGSQPAMPTPPSNPTVIRDGKVRLLVNQKPVELALEKLSEQDRDFVGQIKAALDKKAASN